MWTSVKWEKDACWKVNVTAVENLIEACRKYDVFLEHLSTDFVFDGTSGPRTKKMICQTLSVFMDGANMLLRKLLRIPVSGGPLPERCWFMASHTI